MNANVIHRRCSALLLALMLTACGGGGSDAGSGGTPGNGNNGGGYGGGGNNGGGAGGGDSNAINFQNIAVHDPSVIKVENEYYVFGSHLSAAKTQDLMNWQRVADGVSAANPLFEDVTSELAETFAWAEADTLWATDVIQLADGKFYMYYNACRGDSPLSAMGVAVADQVEGPYQNKQLFLRSGNKASNGEPGYIHPEYNAYIHPNVVDPNVFYDDTGRLWMIYGSYSGGIFILEMDPDTGLPLPDQGYGQHIMGGNHSRIEAPYVLYSPEAEYYYLFTSFGGLAADGAYNIRVARALSPDGPYVDAQGKPMTEVKSNPDLPLFDDASIAPDAMKLMGNFRFPGGAGYVSPGHNSAYYDAETGRHLIFFHTRFPGRGEQHEVRVHEMYINADGWPVIAPHRYVPLDEAAEPLTEAIEAAQVAGDYQLINHHKDITAAIKTPLDVTLQADGSLGGELAGHWFYSDDNHLTLEVDELGSFAGVVSWGWDVAENRFVVTFSALSAEGVSLWGSRQAD